MLMVLNLLICMLFDEIGGRQKPWISRPNGSREYEWNIFLVLFVIILFWYLLAIVLERFQFKGSCEWCLTKCMRKQSSRNNILASIDSKSMFLDFPKEGQLHVDGYLNPDLNLKI